MGKSRRAKGWWRIPALAAVYLSLPVALDAQEGGGPAGRSSGQGVSSRGRAVPFTGVPRPLLPFASMVGLPPRVRLFAGPYAGVGGAAGGGGGLGGGLYRDLLNPSLGVLGVQVEGYIGAASRWAGPHGVLAAGVRSPSLRLGGGAEIEAPGGATAPFLSIMHPLVRGGILRGGLLQATWSFGGAQRARVGVAFPLGQPLVGRDRPGSDRVHLQRYPLPNAPAPAAGSSLDAAVAELQGAAAHVSAVVVPYLGQPGMRPRPGDRDIADSLTAMRGLVAPGARTGAEEVVRQYHESLERAFSLALDARASGTTAEGRAVAQQARQALLAGVLVPFDRLLGQKREPETLEPFAKVASDDFLRRLGTSVPATSSAAGSGALRARAEWVFASVLSAVNDVARNQRRRWGDARLVWLPLQLGLRAEDHETQPQIDSLIEWVTEGAFSDSNQVAYARNEQFQWELYRSLHDARSYHVLWVHDFRGLNEARRPDGVGYRQVAYGYLDALIKNVRRYDADSILPEYHIFLDQYYYELDRSRLWMAALRDPLRQGVRLKGAPPAWQATIDSLQRELRAAVLSSTRLQAEVRARGGRAGGEDGRGSGAAAAWLRQLIAVHVHVNQQADPTFWSKDVVPLVGLPDNALRDHRKLVFYDLVEGDPYRGMLIVTGMGVGENFASADWEDRAELVKGPAALVVKREAARLLMRQGVDNSKLPFFLQSRSDTVPLASRAPVPRFDLSPATAMQLHNEVGYGDKRATLVKALLYTLLPAGSVVKVPDSLWMNPLWASLLLGQALRGGRVLVMAPSVKNAPAPGAAETALAEQVLSRLLLASHTLAPVIEGAGGLLKVGIYDLVIPVDDVPARIDTALAKRARTPWLQKLEPFSPEMVDSMKAVSASLRASGLRSSQPERAGEHPKLHMKAQFFASPDGWDDLFRAPGWGPVMARFFRARAQLVQDRPRYVEFYRLTPPAPTRQTSGLTFQQQVTAERPDHVVYYLLLGSHNEDYRSALLDGESVLLLSHFGAAVGIDDFVLLPSLCTWVETVDELHRYLPVPHGRVASLARRTRIIY